MQNSNDNLNLSFSAIWFLGSINWKLVDPGLKLFIFLNLISSSKPEASVVESINDFVDKNFEFFKNNLGIIAKRIIFDPIIIQTTTLEMSNGN